MIRLKASQIPALARHIVSFLQSKNLALFGESSEQAINFVTEIFQKNFEEEEKLNETARGLLEAGKRKIGQNIDEERAFQMIKKQLAKERNFVL